MRFGPRNTLKQQVIRGEWTFKQYFEDFRPSFDTYDDQGPAEIRGDFIEVSTNADSFRQKALQAINENDPSKVIENLVEMVQISGVANITSIAFHEMECNNNAEWYGSLSAVCEEVTRVLAHFALGQLKKELQENSEALQELAEIAGTKKQRMLLLITRKVEEWFQKRDRSNQ